MKFLRLLVSSSFKHDTSINNIVSVATAFLSNENNRRVEFILGQAASGPMLN